MAKTKRTIKPTNKIDDRQPAWLTAPPVSEAEFNKIKKKNAEKSKHR